MKKLIFCLQNNLIEEILYDKEILNDSSLILRKKEELTYSLLEREKPDLIFFPHWSFKVPAKIFKNFNVSVFIQLLCLTVGEVLLFKI
jgi:methionyl-tRNA formyltransferase